MKKLYTEDEYNNAKSKNLLPLECHNCKNTFYKNKHYIQSTLSNNSNIKRTCTFCSHKCQRQFENPPTIISCSQCSKKIQKKPKDIKRSKHNFCCQSCAAKYNNAHKTKGTRISKLEKWLQEKLSTIYPNLDIHFNRKDIINSELDIYIPSLMLAFELNGIFHYEPIYGTEKLQQTKTNDDRKFQACLENSIELCLIDVSHQKYFKEQTSLQFLDIIKNIINSKLVS